MKKCPTCARTYVDETLNFCLEDGAPLVFGPGADEPATAIMPPSALTGESPTVTYGSAAGSRSSDPNVSSRTTERPTPNRNGLIVGVIGAILISALGAAGWFYYGRSAAVRIESIAVMPFVNESGSGEYEYLSDGMTETLINSLSQLPKLSVKGRSSLQGEERRFQTACLRIERSGRFERPRAAAGRRSCSQPRSRRRCHGQSDLG
jgi:hypothetical protein